MAEFEQLPGRSYRHRYEGPAYRRLLLGGIRYIPPALQRLSMPMWAGIFYGLLPEARRIAERNLDQVLGPASGIERHRRSFRLFHNYAQTLADNYALHFGRRPLKPESIGRPNLLNAVAQGKGVIAATGHIGMWQLGPFLAQWNGLPTFYMAMAEEPNPLVQEFEARFRQSFRILYTTGSPFSALELLQVLRKGHILGLQMDRHIGGKTVAVPFCGRPAHFATGPATLARLSGAPLIPSFFLVEPEPSSLGPRRVSHVVEPPIEVPHTADKERDIFEATSRLVAVYERYVKRYVMQWYQFHDFWEAPARATPDEARRAADAARAAPEDPRPTAQGEARHAAGGPRGARDEERHAVQSEARHAAAEEARPAAPGEARPAAPDEAAPAPGGGR